MRVLRIPNLSKCLSTTVQCDQSWERTLRSPQRIRDLPRAEALVHQTTQIAKLSRPCLFREAGNRTSPQSAIQWTKDVESDMALYHVACMRHVPFRVTRPCPAPPLALFECLPRIYPNLIKSLCMEIRVHCYSCRHYQSVASSRLLLQSPYSVERVKKGRRDFLQKPASRLHLSPISPLQAASLWQALQNRHFSVIATILGFAILEPGHVGLH
jgi:hypothetical protein